MERVATAIDGLEQRLQKKLELLDGYVVHCAGKSSLQTQPWTSKRRQPLHGLVWAASEVWEALVAPESHGGYAGGRYARVTNMIEIEVEMDTEVPAAEVAGIEEQIMRLEEVADMQADWHVQAEAQDEVERLLRAT